MMETALLVILYIAIWSIGIVFGSFFTLAVYRIPKKEDITHVRSYCPKCNHKLHLLDLIPVFSYIFLGGKCRYCKEKIRIRYLLLEVFSGFVFVLIAYVKGLDIDMSIYSLIDLCVTYLFIAGMFIIAGIDKEKKIIPNGLVLYEFGIAILYLLFKIYYLENFKNLFSLLLPNIYGALLIPLVLLIINFIFRKLYKDENKLPFGMGDIKYISVLGLFLGVGIQLFTICFSLVVGLIGTIITKDKEIPWGFYLSIGGIISIVFSYYFNDIVQLIQG